MFELIGTIILHHLFQKVKESFMKEGKRCVGRPIGWRKENPRIMKSMRLDATLLKKLQKVAPEKKFVEKIEEGILLFLEKYEK